MPRRTWIIIPWSIWCKESRMCIWNMQNEEHNEKALKSKWAPATKRLLSYWLDFLPGLVLVLLLPSTTAASLKSKPLPSPPAAAFMTAALIFSVVFAGQMLEVFKNSLAGHKQWWQPAGLSKIAYLNDLQLITAHKYSEYWLQQIMTHYYILKQITTYYWIQHLDIQ